MNRKDIMLIDDNTIDKMIFKKTFSGFEKTFRLVEYNNGEEAWHSIENSVIEPALIFLDVYMPKVSGIDFLIRLRTRPRFKNIPVVLFISEENDPNVKVAEKLGVARTITKPVKTSQIEAIIQEYSLN